MDQGNESILELTFKMTGNGSEAKERFVLARANEPRASVWSARSLLPLFGGTAEVARDVKAPASRAQSKRFAPFYGPR